jgi:glycosyltransferase involved in cell wall biosynthesis
VKRPGATVSVVIPTHNRRHLLQRTLVSVLAQADVDVEVIVVDDGSSDDTPQFLRALGDERVRWIRHERPRRVPAARNAGLERATAPWVAFVDDDDVWSPYRLRSQLDALSGTAASWACTAAVLVDRDLAVVGFHPAPQGGDVADDLLARNTIPGGGSAVLARTDLVRRTGGFDVTLDAAEDWDLWIRLALASPLVSIAQAHVAYMVDASSMSADVGRMAAGRKRLSERYRIEAEARGAIPDESWFLSYVLNQQLVARDRAGAAMTKWKLGRRDGLVRHLPGLVVSAVAPGRALERQRARLRAGAGTAAVGAADRWLAPLRPVPVGAAS